MFDTVITQFNQQLSDSLAGHIRWKVMVTKDTCYQGKVLKIIATNYSKDDPEDVAQVDVRYGREQMIICIPLQNHQSIDEFNDYLNTQLYLATQTINKVLTNDAK